MLTLKVVSWSLKSEKNLNARFFEPPQEISHDIDPIPAECSLHTKRSSEGPCQQDLPKTSLVSS